MQNIKRSLAVLAAGMVLLAGTTAVLPGSLEKSAFVVANAKAKTDYVNISIDRIELTLEELTEKDYEVPVYVHVDTLDTGFSAAEFGIGVDERCSYKILPNPDAVRNSEGELFSVMYAYSHSSANACWITGTSRYPFSQAFNLVRLDVNVPVDSQVGDMYDIRYLEEMGSKHIWRNEVEDISYEAIWVDGYIKIVEPEPTEPPTTEPSTTEPSTTEPPTTEPPTTEPPATESLTYGDLSYKINDRGRITITGCNKKVRIVDVPAEIDGIPVTTIDYSAFANCSFLMNIAIPESVIDIDEFSFCGCTSLKDIWVNEKNQNYSSEDGVLFNKDKTQLILCAEGKQGSYIIPESVTKIDGYAFENCKSLTSITIPKGVTKIEVGTFVGCTGLTDVKIHDSVIKIEWYAFEDCKSLTSVTIPKGVTKIEVGTFAGCTSLTDVKIHDGVTYIGSDDAKGDGAFAGCTSLTSITIPKSVVKIDFNTFVVCTSLTDVYYAGTEEQWNAIEIDEYGNDPLTTATIHFNTTAPATTMYGDVDENGVVNIMDVILLNRNLMVGAEIGAKGMVNADVDCNGTADAVDSLNILKYIVKLITTFPL